MYGINITKAGIIKSLISKLRQKDIEFFFKALSHTLMILGFLTAVQFFSKSPSLKIELQKSFMHGVVINDLIDFYHQNKIHVPQFFLNDNTLKKIFNNFKTETFDDQNYVQAPSPSMDAVIAIQNHKWFPESALKQKIERIKENFEHNSTVKYQEVYISDTFIKDSKMLNIIEYVEKSVSPEELFVFLVASLQARKFTDTILIRNTGDVDLKNVKIIISSPMNSLFNDRINNILDYKVESYSPHEIEVKPENLIVRFPQLSQSKVKSLRLTTRENQVQVDEIFYFYDVDNKIDKKKLLQQGIVILIVILGLKLFFTSNIKTS